MTKTSFTVYRISGEPIFPEGFKKARSAFLDATFPNFQQSCSIDVDETGQVRPATALAYKNMVEVHDAELLCQFPNFINLPLPTSQREWKTFIEKWGPTSLCVEGSKLIGYLMPGGINDETQTTLDEQVAEMHAATSNTGSF